MHRVNNLSGNTLSEIPNNPVRKYTLKKIANNLSGNTLSGETLSEIIKKIVRNTL